MTARTHGHERSPGSGSIESSGPGSVGFVDVSKRFDQAVAVDRLNLQVAHGEFLVVVGPSGCGKTTALRMVAGLETPTAGRILIGGQDVTAMRGRDRDLAMVFQSYALYPHLSVEANIAFGLKQRKVAREEIGRRLTDVTRMLELDGLLDRKPAQLSGGQRQRVALGRAIARQTDVLLMDEPLSNLDAQLRQRARMELSELQARLGTTVLYVTHDQVEAMTMGHRVAVMRDGVLQQCDTPQRVYDSPVNLFVASFIGSPPMNLMSARLTTIRDKDGASHPAVSVGTMVRKIRLDPGGSVGAHTDVLLGIRPEQFEPNVASSGIGSLDGIVRVVEPLGSDQFVTVDIGEGVRVTARLRPEPVVCVGNHIGLSSSLAGTHLFTTADGNRLATLATEES